MNTKQFAQQTAELLRRIIVEIILKPQSLAIEAVDMAHSVAFYVSASGADTPRIIGTAGAHHKALVAIASAAARKHGIDVSMLRVLEPKDRNRDQYPPFAGQAPDVVDSKVVPLLVDIAAAVFTDEAAIDTKVVHGPDFTSHVDLLVSREEPAQLVADMGAALKALFASLGKANGRRLYVYVVNTQESSGQPATAAGRFAPERQ